MVAIAGSRTTRVGPVATRRTGRLCRRNALTLLIPKLLRNAAAVNRLLARNSANVKANRKLSNRLVVLSNITCGIKRDNITRHIPSSFAVPFTGIRRTTFRCRYRHHSVNLRSLGGHVIRTGNHTGAFFSIVIQNAFDFVGAETIVGRRTPCPALIRITSQRTVFLQRSIGNAVLKCFSPRVFRKTTITNFRRRFLSSSHAFNNRILSTILSRNGVCDRIFSALIRRLPISSPRCHGRSFQRSPVTRTVATTRKSGTNG